MADPNSSGRERRLRQGVVHSWQQGFDKEREATRDEDLQREEIPKGNRYRLGERDEPRREPSGTIRWLEEKGTSSVKGSGLLRVVSNHF